MNDRKIYILTGAVQSGKTTALAQWISGKKDVFGILTPVISGKRYFLNVSTGDLFDMEAHAGENNTVSVGKFIFSKTAFQKAETILREGCRVNRGWLVIDEAGPLELRGEGFSEVIKEILALPSAMSVLLVIRENFLQSLIGYFHLEREAVHIITARDDMLKQRT